MTGHNRVSRTFFSQPTQELARALLGLELVHASQEGTCAGRIVEVEAYQGPEDRGAHSYGGRRTARTEVMFGPPGHAYVFLIYGIHYCLNVVSGPEGVPHAILLRGLEPTEGIDLMRRRRKLPSGPVKRLANGPGKLCQALGVTNAQYGWDFSNSPLYLRTPGTSRSARDHAGTADGHPGQRPDLPFEIATGPRINIDYAGEDSKLPWRYWIRGNPCVSVPDRGREESSLNE